MLFLQNFLGYLRSLSLAGVLAGTLFFGMALTPSLLPRTYLLQGVLCGVVFALGYGLGVAGRWLWEYLQIPVPGQVVRERVRLVVEVLCAVVLLACLWQAAGWQNSIRELMHLPPLASTHPVKTGLIAAATAAALFAGAWLFRRVLFLAAGWLRRFMPLRIANVLGTVVAVFVAWTVLDDVIFRIGLRMADSSLRKIDALMEPDVTRPTEDFRTGSAVSLIDWETLGRRGREFAASGPRAEEISRFSGSAAMEPIRVYAGLNSAETPEARAQLALRELLRAGGFEREVLLIAIPTGTGWLDPHAMDTVEFLHHGNIATVAVQYSYLSSWMALLVEPDYGKETARALFEAVYGHWTSLPKTARPRLYLHGLSLGALNSQASADLYDVLADPFSGALWSGPPFASKAWRMATDSRAPDSPAWLPRFRDSSLIRFANQETTAARPGVAWGPLRIVYLQYASDPIVFIEPEALYRQPVWMKGPRGPDVSPQFRWFPVVTFLQLTLDVLLATHAPMGYGHIYAPPHYIDAWVEVTAPEGWPPEEIIRLKEYFERRASAPE